jgi:hypothetical protein
MFWLNGVAAPLLLGGIFALVVWFPGIGALWGIVGGLGGSALGIVGAVYGFMMTAERARIARRCCGLTAVEPLSRKVKTSSGRT